jgi:hypothetical protein
MPAAELTQERSCVLYCANVLCIVLCSDTPAVPVAELPQYLAALPAWQLAEDSKSISRHFVAKNFVAGTPAT